MAHCCRHGHLSVIVVAAVDRKVTQHGSIFDGTLGVTEWRTDRVTTEDLD